jgi:hypothetical protein
LWKGAEDIDIMDIGIVGIIFVELVAVCFETKFGHKYGGMAYPLPLLKMLGPFERIFESCMDVIETIIL